MESSDYDFWEATTQTTLWVYTLALFELVLCYSACHSLSLLWVRKVSFPAAFLTTRNRLHEL